MANTHIADIQELMKPADLVKQYPLTDADAAFVLESRRTVESILQGNDRRLLVIVGPCSIHDYDQALEYAEKLARMQPLFHDLFLVMRVYFEKPRTRKGWKGFIYDPDLDESFRIDKGLVFARRLLLELTRRRIPVGTEFLDTISPQYFADLVSWGAIGARTSESQIHRQLASGLSMPVGFKNLTSGDYEKAVDGILSAQQGHNFLGISEQGVASHVQTRGNPFGHLILRGGEEPNYDEASLQAVAKSLQKEGLRTGFIVDCSHGNSKKEYLRQILVALHMNRIRYAGLYPIRGIMLESNLEKGNQPLSANLRRGVSITDACLDVPSTKDLLQLLNTKYIVSCETIKFARESIRRMDTQICNLLRGERSLSIQHMPSAFHYEMDGELLEICKPYANAEHMLMMLSTRLSFSNRVAELKFAANPFGFLQSDPMNLITDRDIEREIVALDPLFLKIIDLSKRIQLRCMADLCRTFRTGYLFGPGTFSSEAVSKLKGQHIAFPDKDALMAGLREGAVDAVLLPTYNSILGDIYSVDSSFIKGCIEHPIQLSLYSNRYMHNPFSADTLYIEPHILKESQDFVTSHLSVKKIELVKSTREGCLAMLRDEGSAFTIASVQNEFNCMFTLAKNIVDHNVTTFSFVTQKQTQHELAFATIDACIDSHCR